MEGDLSQCSRQDVCRACTVMTPWDGKNGWMWEAWDGLRQGVEDKRQLQMAKAESVRCLGRNESCL